MAFMAKRFEELRARGELDSYTADEAVGIAVNDLMFQQRCTRQKLGEALGVTGQVAGRKLRGEVSWSVADLIAAAELLGVPVTRIMPKRVVKTPAQLMLDGSPVVAGTGFEPVASGPRGGVWGWMALPGLEGGWVRSSTMSHGHQIQPQADSSWLGTRRRVDPLAASSRTPHRDHPRQTAAPHAVRAS